MKKILSIILIAAMILSMAACGSKPETPEAPQTQTSQFPMTVKDQLGNEVTVEKAAERIVSGYYISSSTCIALGLKDKMVGIEEKSDKRPIYKLAAAELIDSAVNVGSAKEFGLEACISAEPDLVILPKKAKDNAASLQELGIPVIVVNPESHEGLVEMVNLIASLTGTEEKAAALIEYYDSVLAKLDSLNAGTAEDAKPSVYMTGTSSYLTTAPRDMYQASVIRTAGGKNAADGLDGDSWVEVSYEQLIAMDPDVIFIPTNNFANGQPDFTADEILADPQLSELKAVKSGSVYNMPAGYEAWDSPVPSGVLGMLWMEAKLSPDKYSMAEFEKDAADFYKTFYGFDFVMPE